MTSLTIESTSNGYIVRHQIEDGSTVCFSDENEREALVKLLTYLGEFYCEPYDRFGSENIRISFDRKGYKAE
ncbi:MAG: hypothetical protein M0R06_06265 [Sphaerochaeta sp.]|jgi:hypothetical protein|nr:hypothetical protein [Sphaerochaeta sp.]